VNAARESLSTEQRPQLTEAVDQSKRNAFLIAAISPIVMAFCYFFLVLFYRSKGGYKPVQLAVQKQRSLD